MAIGPIPFARGNPNTWKAAAAGLVVAAAIVGVAILLGGAAARTLNGIGAIAWLASSVVLALSLPRPERSSVGWVVAVAAGIVLAALVRPGSLLPAVVGFGICGALVVLAAGDRTAGWALLVPAIYLPVHLLIGVGRALFTERGVRTEPLPTAAIVPLAMLVAAAVGGAIVVALSRAER